MASSADLASWKALGGQVKEEAQSQLFIGPSGQTFSSWSEAAEFARPGSKAMSKDAAKGKTASNKRSRAGSKNRLEEQPKPASTRGKKQKAEPKETPQQGTPDEVAEVAQPSADRQQEAADVGMQEPDQDDTVRKGSRQVNYKEQGRLSLSDAKVKAVKGLSAESEQEAIALLADGRPDTKLHRLAEFQVQDKDGQAQPLERFEHMQEPLYISGKIVHPSGPLTKAKGCRVKQIGPVKGWRLHFDGKDMQVVIATDASEYHCLKAAAGYKGIHQPLQEQADIFEQVVTALVSQHGGSLSASFDEVAARLARAKVGQSFMGPRDALAMNGSFILAQLAAWGGSAAALMGSSFVHSLRQEMEAAQQRLAVDVNSSISIRDGPPAAAAASGHLPEQDPGMEADMDMARRLQAKLDVQQARGGQRRGGNQGAPYIRISEEEIADDYPMPAQYKKVEEETDELLLQEDDMFNVDPEALPRRLLTDFAIYNSEGFCASLELLPMWSGVEPDTELFASGRVLDDDGEWSGGQTLDNAAGKSSSAAAGSSDSGEAAGMVLYLSQIQEWIVEFSCDMLFISVRTDVAWYRLSKPTAQYAPWFNVVLKCARLATHILGMLTNEARASRLSFADIVKRCAAADATSTLFVASRPEAVERFVIVHGQVFLNQFKTYPVKAVREAAFVGTLRTRMQQRRHSKLYMAPKRKLRGGLNRNPMRDRAAGKQKPMTATATAMVKGIWASYFAVGSPEAEAEPAAQEVEEDENAEEDEDAAQEGEAEVVEDALARGASPKARPTKQARAKQPVSWPAAAVSQADGVKFYGCAQVGEVVVEVGEVAALAAEADADAADLPPLGLVQALWQTASGAKEMQVRVMVQGCETVLGDAASEHELFVTSQLITRPVANVVAKWNARRLQRLWQVGMRVQQFAEDQALQERNQKAKEAGAGVEYVYRSQYLPEQGMFCQLPDDLRLGQQLPAEPEEPDSSSISIESPTTFQKGGHTFSMGDCAFVEAACLDQLPGAEGATETVPEYAAKSRYHKGGSNAGLRAHGIVQLVQLPGQAVGRKTKQGDKRVEVRRFYRPEDISQEQAYKASYHEVYASSELLKLSLDEIIGPCTVRSAGSACGLHDFECTATFDLDTQQFSEPPEHLRAGKAAAQDAGKAKGKGKGAADKGKGKAEDVPPVSAPAASIRNVEPINDGVALKTLDIFAGCGGLSEGMHAARAANPMWAVEYESPAADAFRLNHPHAAVWTANCNVILAAAMRKAGQSGSCQASKEAEEEVDGMDQATMDSLPGPGQVDFLCGGPPCQGYSGMNRFNKGNWSMVQNSMVMAYLSYADFYRPRYFLLENVRNFVSHNKSFTFRLTLRSLLDMGYQVRFGVLNAGNFGVSQSRKRTFIWGVAPGDLLPQWPAPLHVFRSPQLTINLPGNVQYAAVRQDVGAPLRAVTVKDAIGDLPSIVNGASDEELTYSGPPVSAFQKAIRGGAGVLRDHICKEMNALNLERCRCIPKNMPGADWRVLQEIVASDPSREKFQGQALVPWCLPNTADRHNGWRGLFGRLHWQGHFPTSVTDPQPMGKVGQVFHPDQDRIVSVRECARAQGFPDDFCFSGNVHNKHRQIGNAVPPPLAAALGRQLRAALDSRAAADAQALLDAQMADA